MLTKIWDPKQVRKQEISRLYKKYLAEFMSPDEEDDQEAHELAEDYCDGKYMYRLFRKFCGTKLGIVLENKLTDQDSFILLRKSSWELCPYCEKEIKVDLVPCQNCTNCQEKILCCSMCSMENGCDGCSAHMDNFSLVKEEV